MYFVVSYCIIVLQYTVQKHVKRSWFLSFTSFSVKLSYKRPTFWH